MNCIDSPPIRPVLRRRVLFQEKTPENPDESMMEVTSSVSKRPLQSESPPYRKVRSLRLFDTPSTPKTIIEKSAFETTNKSAKEMLHRNLGVELGVRPIACRLYNKQRENIDNTANVNPFTPDNAINEKKKRRCHIPRCETYLYSSPDERRRSVASLFSNYVKEEEEETEYIQAPKRLALQDTSISRYRREFVEIELIGSGNFGQVYKCKNRLDGTEYAVKRSKRPVAGSTYEKTALNEVWAHAVLGKHDNVVRYFSAWAEESHMLIQNEYCNGGSLQTVLESRFLCESELRTLLTHVAGGLKYIHSNDLCHMDIKSGNIFLSRVPKKNACRDRNGNGHEGDLVIYKIGDLGHVTSIINPNVEEGDCRYLSSEAIKGTSKYLDKVDMFALGMTLYEAGGGGPLPKNGPEWLKFRDGVAKELEGLSKDFNDLIKLLIHTDPLTRPSSTEIFQHPVLCPSEINSMAQLTHELIMERKKNEELLKQLRNGTSRHILEKQNEQLKRELREAREVIARLSPVQHSDTPKNRKVSSTDRTLRSSSSKFLRSGNMYGNIHYMRSLPL